MVSSIEDGAGRHRCAHGPAVGPSPDVGRTDASSRRVRCPTGAPGISLRRSRPGRVMFNADTNGSLLHGGDMKLLLVAALLLLLPATVPAQVPPPRGGLALDLDLVRHGQTDAAASPLKYRGTLPGFSLRYSRVRDASRLELTAAFGAGTLDSRITDGSDPSEKAYMGRLGVRYLRRVGGALGGRVSLLAGAQLDGHLGVREHTYGTGGTEAFADLIVPLQAAAGWDWTPGGTRIGQRLAVPVAAMAMRTPWGGLKHVPAVELAWAWDLLGFDHALFVERTASPRVALRLTWSTLFLRHDEPRELRAVTHRIGAGLVVR